MTDIAMHAFIEGRVQGVGYRAWAEGAARGLKLSGWVRNLDDGRVELLAVGPEDKVRAFLEACERGPRYARVHHVDAEHAEPVGAGKGFRQIR